MLHRLWKNCFAILCNFCMEIASRIGHWRQLLRSCRFVENSTGPVRQFPRLLWRGYNLLTLCRSAFSRANNPPQKSLIFQAFLASWEASVEHLFIVVREKMQIAQFLSLLYEYPNNPNNDQCPNQTNGYAIIPFLRLSIKWIVRFSIKMFEKRTSFNSL